MKETKVLTFTKVFELKYFTFDETLHCIDNDDNDGSVYAVNMKIGNCGKVYGKHSFAIKPGQS